MSIQVRQLRKSFGGPAAVDGIDLDIEQGRMLVLLGPSGCGKTTTMRCIAGLEKPDGGTITINGRSMFDEQRGINVPVNERHVGMVFQSYAIWPHLTVFQNVAFPLEMEKLARTEIERRVGEVLELVGLAGLDKRGASYLSGGQMQRVALARSLVMRPSVLLFDEPLSNLDARLRDNLRVQLRELQTQMKITSVYVTHDQREALALADDIAVMQSGRVLQIGDPVTLYGHPASSTIADFLGYSNVFDVEIVPNSASNPDPRLVDVCFVSGGRVMRALAPGLRPDGSSGPRPGALYCACVRPDHVSIRLAADGADSGGDNQIAGEVILASFMGSHMQYRVRTGEHEIWEVLSANIGAGIRLGDHVVISVVPEYLQILPRE
jgi:iron(III) transport system ATP-binding protein